MEPQTEILYEVASPFGMGYEPEELPDGACARFDAEFKRRVSAQYPSVTVTEVQSLGPGYWVISDNAPAKTAIFETCENIAADLAEHPEVWFI